MSWSVQTERESIKTALAAVSGLKPYDSMPATVSVPAGIVSPAPEEFVTYDTLDGAATLHFMVLVVVRKVSEPGAADALDAYISTSSPTSVQAAMETAQAIVKSVHGYGGYTFGTGEAAPTYLGAQFAVDVLVY